jgi:uncharacterized protein
MLGEIKRLGVKIDHYSSFEGKAKGNQHLLRVVKIALHIAQQIPSARVDIVQAGAWLHDTAIPSGDDYDYENCKKIVTRLIKHYELNEDDRFEVIECVASHEGTVTPNSLEASIVHDADVLEKVGVLGLIRHSWKLTNKDELDPQDITDEDVEKIMSHIAWRKSVLRTDVAKKMAEVLGLHIEKSKAKEIITKAAQMAAQGIIVELIAESFYGTVLNKEMSKKLKEQLDVSVLGE